jgi:hypothetical protein
MKYVQDVGMTHRYLSISKAQNLSRNAVRLAATTKYAHRTSNKDNFPYPVYGTTHSLTHSVALQPWRAQAAVNTVP